MRTIENVILVSFTSRENAFEASSKHRALDRASRTGLREGAIMQREAGRAGRRKVPSSTPRTARPARLVSVRRSAFSANSLFDGRGRGERPPAPL